VWPEINYKYKTLHAYSHVNLSFRIPCINNKYDTDAHMCLLVAESMETEFGELTSLVSCSPSCKAYANVYWFEYGEFFQRQMKHDIGLIPIKAQLVVVALCKI